MKTLHKKTKQGKINSNNNKLILKITMYNHKLYYTIASSSDTAYLLMYLVINAA